eukprot:s1261_g22.t1
MRSPLHSWYWLMLRDWLKRSSRLGQHEVSTEVMGAKWCTSPQGQRTEPLAVASRIRKAGRQAFRCLDPNGDGVLTVEEVFHAFPLVARHRARIWLLCLHKWTEMALERSTFRRWLQYILLKGEFLAAAMDQNRISGLPILWEALSAFDKDRGGTISNDEIGNKRSTLCKSPMADRKPAWDRELEGQLVEVAESCALAIQRELEKTGNSGDLDFEQFVYLMKTRLTSADALNT